MIFKAEITDTEVIDKLDETVEKNANNIRVLKNDNGETVTLSKKALEEMLMNASRPSADNIGGVVNKEAIANLPEIFKTALKVKETNDIRHETQNKIIRYANVFESDGEPIMVKITVKQLKGNRKQLTDIEFENNNNRDLAAYSLKAAKKDTAEKHLSVSDVDKSTLSNSGNNYIINDLIEYVNTFTDKSININGKRRSATNSAGERIAKTEEGLRAFYEWFGDSKVVDEQGRPLVVYHNSGKKRNILSRDYARTTMDIQGVFFAAKSDPYKEYGPVEHRVYLRIENPADFAKAYEGFDMSMTDAGITQREKLQKQGKVIPRFCAIKSSRYLQKNDDVKKHLSNEFREVLE